MELVDEVWIGDRIAAGKIVQREPSRLQVRFELPKGVNPGPYRIHASSHDLEIGIPTELEFPRCRRSRLRIRDSHCKPQFLSSRLS